MNVLVINGSPKGKRSNTYQLTQAFLQGLSSNKEVNLVEIEVSSLDLHPCKGCFACWKETPGSCIQKDDMAQVIEKILWADVVIWSFPLYYFSVPGEMKVLIDRLLPMSLPFMKAEAETGGHPGRYDLSNKRFLLISTCGFYTTKGNYEGVYTLFDHIYGKYHYDTIFCAQGELFRVPELKNRTDAYLEIVIKAGTEYGNGQISNETAALLKEPLYPREVFEKMADASWGLDDENPNSANVSNKKMRIFTRQMAALYNPASWKGQDLILEIEYTDIRETYQIILGKDKSRVIESGFQPATTAIHTPSQVWLDIAQGKIRGDEALMKGMYTVTGDFQIMMNWDTYFGSGSTKTASQETKAEKPKKTNMLRMLLAWSALWYILIPGLHMTWPILLVLALIPILFYKYKTTIWDTVSYVIVLLFTILVQIGISDSILLVLSEAAFGLLWLVSCLKGQIPLCAYYSCNNYGGSEALKNPIFIKTNWIIALGWGIVYIFQAIAGCIFLLLHYEQGLVLLSWLCPSCMGIFTIWFQKWYPARVASGKKKTA